MEEIYCPTRRVIRSMTFKRRRCGYCRYYDTQFAGYAGDVEWDRKIGQVNDAA